MLIAHLMAFIVRYLNSNLGVRGLLLRQQRDKVCETNPGSRKNWRLGEGLTIKSRWTMPCPLRPGLLTQWQTHWVKRSHFNWDTFVIDQMSRIWNANKCSHSLASSIFGSPWSRLLGWPDTKQIDVCTVLVSRHRPGQCSQRWAEPQSQQTYRVSSKHHRIILTSQLENVRRNTKDVITQFEQFLIVFFSRPPWSWAGVS